MRSVWFFILLTLTYPVMASDYDDLVNDLSQFNSLSANFSQSVSYENGQEGPSAYGQMKLLRPQSFYWHIQSPSEQLIVTDGHYLWIYDPDLEQVVRRKQSKNDSVPALLLSGHIESIKHRLTVKKLSQAPVRKYHILMTEKDGQTKSIEMSFRQGRIESMLIHDDLGQKNLFLFKSVAINNTIAKRWFDFTPPKGVDVMIED